MSAEPMYECRYAVHIPSSDVDPYDYHYVKLIQHNPDGTKEPVIRLVKDFKRDIYVTKPAYRNHKQKKEYEELGKLKKYTCIQSDLADTIAKALNYFGKPDLDVLLANEYVYGGNITSTALLKHKYKQMYPDLNSEFTFGIYDVETNVFSEEGEIIIATYVQDSYIYTAVTQTYADKIPRLKESLEEQIKQETLSKLKDNTIIKRDFVFEFTIKPNSYEVVKWVFGHIHRHKPDILSGWNIHFDIEKTVAACEAEGVDPKDVLCDNTIPKHLRKFEMVRGVTTKRTVSGKQKPLPAHEQWHTYKLTAPFFIIDQMSLFKLMRLGEQERAKYNLDFISTYYLGSGKVYIAEAEKYEGLAKHQFMQKKYPLFYIIYNVFDCIRCCELEYHPLLGDLRFKVEAFSGVSDFAILNSQPKRIADEMHFDYLDYGVVIASVGRDRKKNKTYSYDEEDEEVVDDDFDENDLTQSLGLKNWVMTLPSYNVSVNVGLRLISEDPEHRTNMRGVSYDIDATTAYPVATIATNNSKATTWTELISVEDIDEEVFRLQNINIVSSSVNSIEYAVTMFGFPEPIDVLKEFMSEMQ